MTYAGHEDQTDQIEYVPLPPQRAVSTWSCSPQVCARVRYRSPP